MSDFVKAYNITMAHEGGYANDPQDPGEETYKGVARKSNPHWQGWPVIDNQKQDNNFPKCLDDISELQAMVKELYKQVYWDVNNLDNINDQGLANKMFDIGVNMGTKASAKFFQESLNLINRDQKDYKDISVDGDIGPKSMGAYGSTRYPDNLLTCLKGLQFKRYYDIVKRNPVQEKYMNGWLKRI